MVIATSTTHLAVDGIPLDNPATESDSLDGLYDTPTVRGMPSQEIPGRFGDRPTPLVPSAKRILIRQLVYADVAPDGTPHPTPDVGLEANIDWLKRLLQPSLNRPDGTFELTHVRPGGNRTARATVTAPFATILEGVGVAVAILDLWVPGGVLRDAGDPTVAASATVTAGNTGDVTIGNPGTADQAAVTYTLTGTATSVRITNLTWDPAGGCYLDCTSPLGSGDVVIDTGAYTALRGTTDVHGLIDTFTPGPLTTWLPLLRGVPNTLRVAPTGGTCTLTVSHRPAWR